MTANDSLVRVNAATIKAKKAARASKPNKSEFVRAHPNQSPVEIVALAAQQGLRLSRSLVYEVRRGGSAAPKRGPGRPPKASAPTPLVKRGPGRPRKQVAPHAPPAAARRGPGRPRKNPVAHLTGAERQIVELFLQVGVARSEELLGSLKRALGA